MLAKKPENTYVRSMVIQMSHQPSNRLIEAYNQMMASIRSAFETSDDEEMSLSKAMSMMETSSEFSDWLMLDIEVIERKLIDLFLSVADKTRVELEQFGVQNRGLSQYYSGEITGPGTLQCNACGHKVAFTTTSQIENCTECGHNSFRRADFRD